MLDLGPYLRRPVSTLAAVAADPIESCVRFWEQYTAQRERSASSDLYKPVDNWADRLNSLLGVLPANEAASEFWNLWRQVMRELEAKGIRAGPSSFKGWNDGDAAFVRAIWCLTRYLQPRNVVETGVGHGVTSRFILEALERNGGGHLWSIDRPPIERDWQKQIGLAVGEALRHRWSYIRGSSRRRLPAVLSKLGQIELFVHDSLHSEHNVRFEMDRAWAALHPCGAIIVDDIDVNRGFASFTQTFSGFYSIIGEAEPLRPDLRRFNKRGLFGIILKERIASNES